MFFKPAALLISPELKLYKFYYKHAPLQVLVLYNRTISLTYFARLYVPNESKKRRNSLSGVTRSAPRTSSPRHLWERTPSCAPSSRLCVTQPPLPGGETAMCSVKSRHLWLAGRGLGLWTRHYSRAVSSVLRGFHPSLQLTLISTTG